MVAATHLAEKNVWAGGTVVARNTRDRFDFWDVTWLQSFTSFYLAGNCRD
jgi:hypothetical protein